MEKKKQTGLFRKLWVIFRDGKGEIWFLMSLYNTFQLWKMRQQNMNTFYLMMIGLFGLALVWGYIDIKKVKTSNPYLQPYAQDTLKASILLYDGFIELIDGQMENAKQYFIDAKELREKWID
jgi:hypothetical protein